MLEKVDDFKREHSGRYVRNIGNKKGKGRSDVFLFHKNIIKISFC